MRVRTGIWIAALAVACDGSADVKDDTLDTAPLGPRLPSTTFSATTDFTGTAELAVDVPAGTLSFLMAAQGPEGTLAYVDRVYDPSGALVYRLEDWYFDHSDETLSMGVLPIDDTTTLNWPILDEHGALSPGTWVLHLRDWSGGAADVTFEGTVQTRLPQTENTLRALVVYAAGVSDEAEVVEATEAAVQVWADIWSAWGLSLEVRYAESDVDPDLPNALEPGDALAQVSAMGEDWDVTVIIGETQEGTPYSVLGSASSIPGPLTAARRSAVLISWPRIAGPDGRFSEDDIGQYGNTLAHELGHFAGLTHPVEVGWDRYDAVSDTPRCTTTGLCEAQLGGNLMFPYVMCPYPYTDCDAQDELSSGQQTVLLNYTGLL
ncbi:MAG: hypothetical protein H6739_01500 [Alphaproteobacteria bacterium]|nr:hypothetical protein [Alphaproteobacteria bacterium]